MLKSGTQIAPPRYIPSPRFARVKVSFMHNRKHRGRRRSSGQALIESAILIPFLLMLVFNAINFGYFYYVAMNMSAATRSGALYAILGPDTPVDTSSMFTGSFAPAATTTQCKGATDCSVAYVVYQDMLGSLPSAAANASVQVCSQSFGTSGTGATLKATCTSAGTATFTGGAPSDPEAGTANFILHQVDVKYTFSPLIPGTPFGAILLATPTCTATSPITCTFHRKVLMRAM